MAYSTPPMRYSLPSPTPVKRRFLLFNVRFWASVESRFVTRLNRAPVKLSASNSFIESNPPSNVCGRMRPVLAESVGSFGINVPYLSSERETFIFAVSPNRLNSFAARLPECTGNNPVPERSGLESSLSPSIPIVSSPKPTGPDV
ncbi:hypothetical protein D3C85_1255590 [compost metagenome]